MPVQQLPLTMSKFCFTVISISPSVEVYFILNLYSSFYISMSVADITSFSPRMTQLFLWPPVTSSEWGDIIAVAELASFQRASYPQQSSGTQLQSPRAKCMVTWQLHPRAGRIVLKIHKVNKPYFKKCLCHFSCHDFAQLEDGQFYRNRTDIHVNM